MFGAFALHVVRLLLECDLSVVAPCSGALPPSSRARQGGVVPQSGALRHLQSEPYRMTVALSCYPEEKRLKLCSAEMRSKRVHILSVKGCNGIVQAKELMRDFSNVMRTWRTDMCRPVA